MPCGTGKTLVAIEVNKKLKPKRSLVLAPNLELISQLLNEYIIHLPFDDVMVVCGDDATCTEAREVYNIRSATTDAEHIRKFLSSNKRTLMLSTYHSSPMIAEAFQYKGTRSFNLITFDEAHRTSGGDGAFATALDDEKIPSKKRLFMTATPRVATRRLKAKTEEYNVDLYSMDDESVYGKQSHVLSFSEAIDKKLLADYQVVIFGITESELEQAVKWNAGIKSVAKQTAMVKAMEKYDVKKAFCFLNRRTSVQSMTNKHLPWTIEYLKKNKTIKSDYWLAGVTSDNPMPERRKMLNDFAALDSGQRAVINNCRILGEGVDCPEVDGVVFFDKRSQPTDIVQSIGRAIRSTSDANKVATIILPMFIPKKHEDDIDEFVASSEFSQVWDVLAALKSHDNRIGFWIDSLAKNTSSTKLNLPKPKLLALLKRPGMTVDHIARATGNTSAEVRQFAKEASISISRAGKIKLPKGFNLKQLSDPPVKITLPENMRFDLNSKAWRKQLASKIVMRATRSFRPPFSDDLVFGWMIDYFKTNGSFPSYGSTEKTPDGSTWCSIASAFTKGGRGLTKMRWSEAQDECRRRMGLPVKAEWNDDVVFGWMIDYHNEHGRFPLRKSKEKTPDGSTWISVVDAFTRGNPGLTKMRWSEAQGECRRRMGLPVRLAWSDDLVFGWMIDYFKTNGSFPSYGSTDKTPDGSTWNGIAQAFSRGRQGLTKMSCREKKKECLRRMGHV